MKQEGLRLSELRPDRYVSEKLDAMALRLLKARYPHGIVVSRAKKPLNH